MKVTFPECAWCKRRNVDIFRCRSCHKFSCYDCLVEMTRADRCLHKKYEYAESTGWGNDTES